MKAATIQAPKKPVTPRPTRCRLRIRTILVPIVLLLALTLSTITAAPQKRTDGARPLTFSNTISFFREALRMRPLKADARIAVFAEGEWKNRDIYNHSVIFIENADEDVAITFIMSGDEGMNWVNEFFDSPFFVQPETEALFALLNRGIGTRSANIGRYRVELSRWEPRHHEIVSVSLMPRGQRASE